MGRLFTVDDYGVENQWFQVLGYDIEVKDMLIAEALQALSEKNGQMPTGRILTTHKL